jgi:hypothetical protein
MSAAEIRRKIAIVEKALKEAKPGQAIDHIIDVLKEIASTLEGPEKPANKETS